MSTITLKAGTGYNAPWFVSEESDLGKHRENLLGFAGLREESTDEHGNKLSELSLVQLTALVNELFAGAFAVTGQNVDQNRYGGGGGKPSGGGVSSRPKATAATTPEQDFAKKALEFIGSCGDRAALQKFFANNRSELEGNAEAMSALQSKFAELK